MTWEFDFDGSQVQTLEKCKAVLEQAGYEIYVYAPESNLVATEVAVAKYYLRRYDYQVIVLVTDRIQVFLSATKFVYKRSSEWSLFGKEMLDYDVEDRLPVRVQEKILEPLGRQLKQMGYLPFAAGKSRVGNH